MLWKNMEDPHRREELFSGKEIGLNEPLNDFVGKNS
jgi:hypothetical protein